MPADGSNRRAPSTATGRTEERVPDWLLGGKVRRRVLERLGDDGGWSANALAEELEVNRAWVFEIYRGLRGLDALDTLAESRYRLADSSAVGRALRDLLAAAAPYEHLKVDRPAGRVRRARRR